MKPQLILKLNAMTVEKDAFLVCGTLTFLSLCRTLLYQYSLSDLLFKKNTLSATTNIYIRG